MIGIKCSYSNVFSLYLLIGREAFLKKFSIGSNLIAKNQLKQFAQQTIFIFAGVFSRDDTPDPIPNSEVKLSCGDGIARVSV